MPKFTIEVRTKGFVDAKTAIEKTSKSTRSFIRESNRGKDITAAFRREVSALRNNMLLVSFAIFGTVRALGNFVKIASDARESLNKFQVVFGDFAPEVERFAQSITDSFGIAKQEMIALLSGLQDTFVPMGFSREQASELSQSIAQLALDVGSFQNVATADVANRFTSAIVGNHEAVRSLGISLTEATLKTEAMRLGLGDASGELDQTQKIMARMSLIARGSADAIGDLDRTSEEFANRLRATQGRILELRRQLGEMLIPLAEASLTFVDFMASTRKMAIALTGLGIAFTAYAAGAIKAAIAQASLNATMKRNLFIFAGTTLALAIDSAGAALGLWGSQAEKSERETKDLNQTVEDLKNLNIDLTGGLTSATDEAKKLQEAQADLAESIHKSEEALLLRLVTMQQTTELDKASTAALINEGRALTMLEVERLVAIDNLIEHNKQKKESIRLAKQEAENNLASLDNLDAFTSVFQESLMIQAELDGASDLEIEKMRLRTELAQNLSKAIDGSAGSYTEYMEALEAGVTAEELANGVIEGSIENQRMLAFAIVDNFNKKVELAEVDATTTAALKLQKTNMEAMTTSFQQAAGAINVLSSAFSSLGNAELTAAQKTQQMIKVMGALMMTLGAGTPVGAIGMVLSAMGSVPVGHTGGLIKDSGIQRFATGGMVQGQDNVPIMAQAGEFIMQRSAVNNIGVQNLAAMNSGQVSAGVTVNIQGNMIGNDEFIRDNLIPQLNKAANQDLA